MFYKIDYESHPIQKDLDVLSRGIALHAKDNNIQGSIEPFAFFIRDENSKIKAGCNGFILYSWLYVDQLWVDKALRRQGYGRTLMSAAEELAVNKKCVSAAVNTATWEALDFYKKLGYRVEFTRRGWAGDSEFYFMRKDFYLCE